MVRDASPPDEHDVQQNKNSGGHGQVVCADPFKTALTSDPSATPIPSQRDICDGSDVHLGPGAFLDYPLGASAAEAAVLPMVTAKCPGDYPSAHTGTRLVALSACLFGLLRQRSMNLTSRAHNRCTDTTTY